MAVADGESRGRGEGEKQRAFLFLHLFSRENNGQGLSALYPSVMCNHAHSEK